MTTLPNPCFDHEIRIYYEDTDAAGIVYYANYLKFIERSRTEWLRCCGIELSDVEAREGCQFAVSHIDARYHKPAQLDDLLDSRVSVERVGKASLVLDQRITKHGELLFSARVTLACIDSTRFKPRAMPADMHSELQRWKPR